MKLRLITLLIFAFGGSQIFAQSVSIIPGQGNRGQTLPVIVSGQNTSFTSQASGTLFLKQGTFTFSQGSVTVNPTYISPTELNAVISVPNNAPNGWYDLYVNKRTILLEVECLSCWTRNQYQYKCCYIQPGRRNTRKYYN